MKSLDREPPHVRPDIRAQLTGSFTDVDQRFTKERHCTRDASRDIKPGCQDHHPAAIAPRPPPSDPRPTGRGARLLPRLRRRSRRWLSDIVGLPIAAVDRGGGLTRCRRWRTCWTSFRTGGTTCPLAWQTARQRKRSTPCWSCAVMLNISTRSSCQKASDGTDGAYKN